MPESGVLAAADAVFDMGMGAFAGIEVDELPAGVSVTWAV
jgi:hypothetical protein